MIGGIINTIRTSLFISIINFIIKMIDNLSKAQELIYDIIDQITDNTKSFTKKINNESDITKLLLSGESCIIHFYKVVFQYSINLCGFHALYSILNYIQYRKAKTDKESIFFLQEIFNRSHFWSFHKSSVDFLINKMNLEIPSKKQLVNLGPLERNQFKYLVQNVKEYKSIMSTTNNIYIDLTFAFYGFGIFQGMSKHEVLHLQNQITSFVKANHKLNILVIVLGITNHWSVLILEKEKNSFNVDFKYFDSKQIEEIFLLYKDEKKIEEFILERDRQKQNYGHKPIDKWGFTVAKQWFEDINKIMHIIFNAVYNHISICSVIIEEQIRNVISSFESCFSVHVKGVGIEKIDVRKIIKINEETVLSLLSWLSGHYHPKTIWSDIVDSACQYNLTGKNIKSIQNIQDFLCFIKILKNIFDYAIINKLIIINNSSYSPDDRLIQWLDNLVNNSISSLGL